jgi:hypothetical protein
VARIRKATLALLNSSFTRVRAASGPGAAVNALASTLSVADCAFTDARSERQGGGEF